MSRRRKSRPRGSSGRGSGTSSRSRGEFGVGGRASGARDRKTMQLCKQVEQAIYLALAGMSEPEILREVAVESVMPDPDASQLAVVVTAIDPNGEVDGRAVLDALGMVSGILRDEVAGSINRRKTPSLMFRYHDPRLDALPAPPDDPDAEDPEAEESAAGEGADPPADSDDPSS